MDTKITVTGQLFLPNENITLDWDGDPTKVVGSVTADSNGAFSKDVLPFATATPGKHTICATVPPAPCASFNLTGPATTPSPTESPSPSPSPSPSESPSPSPSPSPTPVPPLNGMDLIMRPPFVFLPIVALLALLGAIGFWIFGRRSPPSLPSATVVHRSVRPEGGPVLYGGAIAAGSPSPGPPPAPAPPPPAVSEPPAPPPPPPAGPAGPSAPDEPPDLPEPGE